jgi:hypothetical protein
MAMNRRRSRFEGYRKRLQPTPADCQRAAVMMVDQT